MYLLLFSMFECPSTLLKWTSITSDLLYVTCRDKVHLTICCDCVNTSGYFIILSNLFDFSLISVGK